jgi:hypothetical protein
MVDNPKQSDCSTFCPLPWNSINIRNNGDIRICCNANSYTANRGIVRHDNGTPYNASRDNLQDSRNSELSREVRATMLRGEWHPECERCRQEEKNGVLSRRQMEYNDWDLTPELAEELTAADGSIKTEDFPLEFFDIRYGNFCNLKCRMCGPTDSHTWFDDFVKLNDGKAEYKDTHEKIVLTKNAKGRWETDQYDWFKGSNMYWTNFEDYTQNAKKLYIVGGEPLIIEEHVDSLERLIHNGSAANMQIEYNTNLTNVTPRMLELWKHFKEIRIGASIDACNEIFDYQRAPAKWEHVYENLKKIEANNEINFKCWFAFTITPLNVFHFPEFMRWKVEESGLTKFNPTHSWRPLASFHMCHSPKYYNIKVLPDDIKQEISRQYSEWRNWMINSNNIDNVKKHFVKHLDSVEKFMLSESYADGECWSGRTWLEEFVMITKRLDEIRGQNILDIVPEYKSLFDENN